jgi:hypothetical protein
MDSKARSSILLALAEVVNDSEVIELISEYSGQFNDISELCELEKRIMEKVTAYRLHDLWPPEIAPVTKVLNFNS